MSNTTQSVQNNIVYNAPDGRSPVGHYMRGGVECIDVMKAICTPAEFQAFCRLTAFKYLYRMGQKDSPVREAKKALDYMRWLVQSMESELEETSTETPNPGGLY